MYNNPEDPLSEYESTINKLSVQISELFSKLHFYQALLAEKDIEIKKLKKENVQLKVQIQNFSTSLKPPTFPSQDSYTLPPLPVPQQTTRAINVDDARINKRVCPNCGAMGFAIREVDDKTNIISYSPRRMYAKKKICTKCTFEW